MTDSRAGKSVEYDYSIGGLLNSITDNHGNKTAYLYDPVGRLTGIRSPDRGLISYVYDAGGRLQQKVFPNDLITAYQYFQDNQVKSITTSNSSGTELIRHDYTYNNSGYTETASHTIGGATQARSYEYDGLGRLIKERDTVNSLDLDQIAYDPYGNRRQRTVGGVTHFYSHNNLHQISDIRQDSGSGAVVANFSYDDNGNMISKTFAGVTTNIGYDALDRLVSVSKDGLDSEQYGYDHGIRRIQKTVGTTEVNYHYSGPDIIGEYDNNWTTPQAIYAHGAAMDDPLLRLTGSDSAYYHGDALGSVVGVSDSSAVMSATNRYDAWGNVTESTGTTAQYGYTGREPDATGLVYYRARYYDPQIGRFTQPDPKGFINGINRYTYVMNSPVNYVDPWGTMASSHTTTGNDAGYVGTSTGNSGWGTEISSSAVKYVSSVLADPVVNNSLTLVGGLAQIAGGCAITQATAGIGAVAGTTIAFQGAVSAGVAAGNLINISLNALGVTNTDQNNYIDNSGFASAVATYSDNTSVKSAATVVDLAVNLYGLKKGTELAAKAIDNKWLKSGVVSGIVDKTNDSLLANPRVNFQQGSMAGKVLAGLGVTSTTAATVSRELDMSLAP